MRVSRESERRLVCANDDRAAWSSEEAGRWLPDRYTLPFNSDTFSCEHTLEMPAWIHMEHERKHWRLSGALMQVSHDLRFSNLQSLVQFFPTLRSHKCLILWQRRLWATGKQVNNSPVIGSFVSVKCTIIGSCAALTKLLLKTPKIETDEMWEYSLSTV